MKQNKRKQFHQRQKEPMSCATRQTVDDQGNLEPVVELAKCQLLLELEKMLGNFVNKPGAEQSFRLGKRVATNDRNPEYIRLRLVADTLMLWHTRTAFLTRAGLPKPLPATGAVSLTTLARTIAPSRAGTAALLQDLLDLKVVKQSGQSYVPAQRSAVLGGANALTLAYATTAISRLIQTISHNVNEGAQPRYERQVSEVRIHAEDLPIFLHYVEQQGQYLIDAVDDWLSKRKAEGAPRNTDVDVGFSAFSWVHTPSRSYAKAARSTKRDLSRK